MNIWKILHWNWLRARVGENWAVTIIQNLPHTESLIEACQIFVYECGTGGLHVPGVSSVHLEARISRHQKKKKKKKLVS